MSGYPPPPPPPPQQPGYNPNDPYGREQWKAQRRMMQAQQRAAMQQQKMQMRMQRAQFKAQARAARRGSLVGPILVVTLGVVFLLTQTGHLSWSHVTAWYGRWWPAVLIAAGVLLIVEWTMARDRQEQQGVPFSRPILGGGIVFLLIVLALVGLGIHHLDEDHMGWSDHLFHGDWTNMMGESHDSDDSVSASIAAGQTLMIRNAHGDVTLTGSSNDGQVHVAVHKTVHAWEDSEAEERERQLQPVFSTEGGQLTLTVPGIDGGDADLTVEVPHESVVTIEANHGDVTVSELHAPLTLTANRGDVELSAIDGPVTVHVNHDDASVTGHSMTGPVTVQGRSGDINFSDIAGGVSLQGDFFGTTHLEHIQGVVRFDTTRTHFEAARLDGEFEVDTGSDLQADQLLGPVTLTTTNKNITFDRVSGKLDISNTNGSVNVTNAPPLDGVRIVNKHGSIDLGVPGGAGFSLNASTQHGDLENDFGLQNGGSKDAPTLMGTVLSGGPSVYVSTSDGDVTVRKSSVEPLPSVAPRRVDVAPGTKVRVDEKPERPEKPEAPEKPETPKGKAPKAPKAPVAPAAPGTSTF